jgi:hypothetical protein
MKFLVYVKHCDSYKWTKSMNHVKNLIIIISQKKIDGANNNYVNKLKFW